MKQTQFSFVKQYKKEFGGEILIGKRKERRPLSTKDPIHLVLRPEDEKIFAPGNIKLENILSELAQQHGIRIYQKSFNWNHLHLLVTIPSRIAYNSFIRQFTAKVAQLYGISGAFTLRPYTRVMSWGKDFNTVRNYHQENNRQAWRLSVAQMEMILEQTSHS